MLVSNFSELVNNLCDEFNFEIVGIERSGSPILSRGDNKVRLMADRDEFGEIAFCDVVSASGNIFFDGEIKLGDVNTKIEIAELVRASDRKLD